MLSLSLSHVSFSISCDLLINSLSSLRAACKAMEHCLEYEQPLQDHVHQENSPSVSQQPSTCSRYSGGAGAQHGSIPCSHGCVTSSVQWHYCFTADIPVCASLVFCITLSSWCPEPCRRSVLSVSHFELSSPYIFSHSLYIGQSWVSVSATIYWEQKRKQNETNEKTKKLSDEGIKMP